VGGGEGSGGGGGLNIGALTLGVATLIGVLGTFTLTGTVGRVFRNDPEDLRASLVLLLIGAAFLAAAGLPATDGITERICYFSGAGLTLAGLLLGVAAGADSVDDVERPAIAAQLVDDGLRLKGNVKVGNMSSDASMAVLVDGLQVNPQGVVVAHATIHKAYVGPDSDGKIDLPIDVRLPAGAYDEVGVKAWTSTERDRGDPPVRPCSEHSQSDVGTGCVRLPLPPVPTSPQLTMQWRGQGQTERQLRIVVTAENAPTRLFAREGCGANGDMSDCPVSEGSSARVAIRVKANRRGSDPRVLYRSLLRPDGRGDLHEVVLVPVRRRMGRVCAEAAFVVGDTVDLAETECPFTKLQPGHVAVELRPVGGRKRGS
jgi:hypothetical protein